MTALLPSPRGLAIMVKEFSEDGVSFRYPDNWTLTREDGEHGWTVTVQSPATAFLVVACDFDLPGVEEVAQTALTALRSEYPELEADGCVDTLAGRMAVGHDIDFFSLDLTNTAWTRSLYGEKGTLLVWWQSNDLELPRAEPVLKAILTSLRVEGE
jgi:hypothetical protein